MIVIVNVSQPNTSTIHIDVTKTYVDGTFFCVEEPEGIYKYQLSNLWLVVEKEDEEKGTE